MSGTIYLLHFSEPYKHARHYVGFTTNLTDRIRAHAMGSGARLVAVVRSVGIDFVVARTWKGNRQSERQIKNRKETPKLCPVCNPKAMKLAKAIS